MRTSMKESRAFGIARFLAATGAVAAVVAAAAPSGAQVTPVVDVLDRAAAPTAVTASGLGALRARSARFASAFRGASYAASLTGRASLRLPAFDDVTLDLTRSRVTQRAGGAITWQGAVAGKPGSRALFVASAGVLAGNVQVGSRVYQVRGRPDGTVFTTEVETAQLPPEAVAALRKRAYLENPCRAETPVSTPTNVDVMVAYTAASEADVPQGSTMATEIELAIEDANAAYEASGLALRLTMVGPNTRYEYTESGFQTDVDRLTATNDGHLDGVHALRDQHHADAVVLMVHESKYCGLASGIQDTISTSFADEAFALVNLGCASSNHSFVHELGHLMGARHDPGVDSSGTAYAHGLADAAHGFRTVMAYRDVCEAQGKSCPRIGMFSSPNLSHDGHPTGTATNDNVRRLDETRLTVSRFRIGASDASLVPVGPPAGPCLLRDVVKNVAVPANTGRPPAAGVQR